MLTVNRNEERQQALHAFVAGHLPDPLVALTVASADASFRNYWRATTARNTYIVMDSPPDTNPVATWLDIAARLRGAGLHAPEVHASDVDQGFLLLEDLGERTYLPALGPDSADALYDDALHALAAMQASVETHDLPPYDHALMLREMMLMPEWFLRRHLGSELTPPQQQTIERGMHWIIGQVLDQPMLFVHRDFHSRNLLVTAHNSPGIVDFQDAVHGPLTYDLVSLLRDCYIEWPTARVDDWAEKYRLRAVASGLTNAGRKEFRRWFDLTGLQRHIKVLGIFCRLCYRDGKSDYLNDLPLVLRYSLDTLMRYPELHEFATLIESSVSGREIRQPAKQTAPACTP